MPLFKTKRFTTICRGATLVLALALPQAGLTQGYDGEPTWSYGVAPPVIDPSTVYELPGSGRSFTHGEIRNPFGPADWYPDSHPAMPDIVANGRYPDVWACALCHYPNGQGRPENGPIAGLPRDYFIQQMQAFRNGERKSAQPRKFNTHLMTTIAQGMTDEQIEQLAERHAATVRKVMNLEAAMHDQVEQVSNRQSATTKKIMQLESELRG